MSVRDSAKRCGVGALRSHGEIPGKEKSALARRWPLSALVVAKPRRLRPPCRKEASAAGVVTPRSGDRAVAGGCAQDLAVLCLLPRPGCRRRPPLLS